MLKCLREGIGEIVSTLFRWRLVGGRIVGEEDTPPAFRFQAGSASCFAVQKVDQRRAFSEEKLASGRSAGC
jgi:hypothetical protein